MPVPRLLLQPTHLASTTYGLIALALTLILSPSVFGQTVSFDANVRPLLEQFCVRCHTLENQESGIRLDDLTSEPSDRQLYLLENIQKQINEGAMPPEDEPQLSNAESELLVNWISSSLIEARSRHQPRNGSIRRLTVAQYRNTLSELLGLDEDLTDTLPPDAVSRDGFTNNVQSMVLSPLQVESYIDIAATALDRCIVDVNSIPVIQTFRMEAKRSIRPRAPNH
jgi:Protein of unknown function (DUF1587)/Planctomycete cytochrome C